MSTFLWRYYLENDLDKFKHLLATANYSSAQTRPSYAGTLSSSAAESPGKTLATSPLAKVKGKSRGGRTSTFITLTRADINSKDAHGVTLLHLIASSGSDSAVDFGFALLEISLLDLYIQDLESGWTALHRALYSGNILLARAIMDRDIRDMQSSGGASHAGGLIKIKDHEGNSPFDVYATTIAARTIPHGLVEATLGAGDSESSDEGEGATGDNGNGNNGGRQAGDFVDIGGDELFAFGSNKNLTLGFGDEDDRQFPERLYLKRPQNLQQLFRQEHMAQLSRRSTAAENDDFESCVATELPAAVDFKPIRIQDVQLSKLHSAVLTEDPESNLFTCGYGKGGRLGTGDEATRFNFTNVSGGGLQRRKITAIGLGQNHTIAVSSKGEVFTWGSNAFGQLGYALANQGSADTDPMQLYPRQLFGLLKREFVVGCAASRTHSVLFTNGSLYTFGKHDGQLGLIDSDSRSLEMQVTPRKVAASLFSSPVSMVTAIDRATACLLENHDVWVFANYGYAKVIFPLDGFSNYFLKGNFSSTHYDRPNYIAKICSGGDTICALAREGDVYTVNISQKMDPTAGSSSTTNPTKIKGALSAPQRIWSLKKEHMAVQDVDVGQDGSIIICTNAGSVWRRVKRAKIKDANAVAGSSEYKPKDYKFSRIPGLTRVAAVRSNAFGAFAAVRKDCDVLRNQVEIAPKTLWRDVFPLLAFHDLAIREDSDTENPAPRLWKPQSSKPSPATIRQAILTSKDIEADLASSLEHLSADTTYDVSLGSTLSDIRIPCHTFLLMARSTTLRKGFVHFQKSYYFEVPDVLLIEYDKNGRPSIVFSGIDILTLMNLVLYLYTDSIASLWSFTRQAPQMAHRYREVRIELMKLAAQLDVRALEHAARLMSEPGSTMHKNLDLAVLDPSFFSTGDVEIELMDGSIKVHSALICRRCPFFEGMFHGRAGGGWLQSRREGLEESQEAVKVDLKHVNTSCFTLVLRHLYSDAGEEIFEDVIAADLETYLDLVLDVLAVANELMIDRLAQICQKVIGYYVNTRNVCWLLNAIAPCSVTGFKDAALEYICLNLEGMLENHILDELDEDLVVDLNRVIRDNQLSFLPIARSGRAEEELIEQYPELIEIMERSKQIKIDSMALQSRYHEDEAKMAKYTTRSPLLRAKASSADMMFNMDEDELDLPTHGKSPSTPVNGRQSKAEADLWMSSPPSSMNKEDAWFDSKGKRLSLASASVQGRPLSGLDPSTSNTLEDESPTEQRSAARKNSDASPWADLATAKLSMKQIMAQASEGRQSNIASAIGQSASPASQPGSGSKLSQKERKRLQQQQQQQQLQKALDVAQGTSQAETPMIKASPWQAPTQGPKVSLKDELRSTSVGSESIQRRPSPGPSLTMRQTIPGNAKKDVSPQPQSPHAKRSMSSPVVGSSPSAQNLRPTPQSQHSQPGSSSANSPIVPRSVRHNTGRATADPSLQLSITDILAQQQIEKDLIKEATAKRSLQEIQEEQAFQEWWDQEEAATRARIEQEEAAAKATSSRSSRGGRGGRGGRGKGKSRGGNMSGRGGKGRGSESAAVASSSGVGKST